MFERYTDEAKRAVFFANWEAQQHGANYIDTLHLLLGISREKNNRANSFLRLHDSYSRIKETLCPASKPPHSKEHVMALNRESKLALAWASEVATCNNDYWIDTCHLVSGLCHEENCLGAQQLSAVGITRTDVENAMAEHPPDFGPIPRRYWKLEYHLRRILLSNYFLAPLSLLLILGLMVFLVWLKN